MNFFPHCFSARVSHRNDGDSHTVEARLAMEQRNQGQGTGNNNGGGTRSELGDEAALQLDELRHRMAEINGRMVTFIKERPGTAILIAVGAGYLIGRILRS
jgi:hypothetical protein